MKNVSIIAIVIAIAIVVLIGIKGFIAGILLLFLGKFAFVSRPMEDLERKVTAYEDNAKSQLSKEMDKCFD